MSDWKAKTSAPSSTETAASEESAAPKRIADGARPNSKREESIVHVFRDLVATMEHEVRSLDGVQEGDLAKAVSKIAASSAKSINGIVSLFRPTSIANVATSLVQRLDLTISRLFVIGRRHHLAMRETHLEELFDAEDTLSSIVTTQSISRAERYYDDRLGPVPRPTDATPNAEQLVEQLTAPSDHAQQGTTRDDLVRQIQGFSSHLARALDDGWANASTIIKEPNAPKRPEMLEVLAEIAADLVMACAASTISSLMAQGFQRFAKVVDLEAHIGHGLTEILLDGFKDSGKESPKKIGALLDAASSPAEKKEAEHGPVPTKLSPKSIYLMAAKRKTTACMNKTETTFDSFRHVLNRVPITTLEGVTGAFTPAMSAKITTEFTNQLVREWVNFGKEAMDQGEEVRDPDMIPKHVSKLDQAYGVLQIAMQVDASGQSHFVGADVAGLGDAVLANLRGQSGGIANLALSRHVSVWFAGSEHSMSFDIAATGKVTADLTRIATDNQVALANLADHNKPGESLENAVLAGISTLVRQLGTIECDKIQDSE